MTGVAEEAEVGFDHPHEGALFAQQAFEFALKRRIRTVLEGVLRGAGLALRGFGAGRLRPWPPAADFRGLRRPLFRRPCAAPAVDGI
jgi:hypothetical protein